jgi:DNA-binding transcriptional ArsR family regulator
VAVKQKFTRMPKTEGIMEAGVPAYTIGTLCVLSDHANSKNGLCWPSMNRLARILGCSVRTVQRHLHVLKDKGLLEFVERRRNRGRYSSYLYRVLHIVRTTGHGRRVEGRSLYKRELKNYRTPPNPKNREKNAGNGKQNGDEKAMNGSLSKFSKRPH